MSREPFLDFDYNEAKQSIDAYSRSVGIGCIVIDCAGETLYQTEACSGCGFCEKVRGLNCLNLSCQKTHLYGSYQAERFGGAYIFFCPLGLVHWASPIINRGTMQGAVLGGPVLMMEPEEFLLDEILYNNNIDKSNINELRRYIKQVPIVSPERVNELSRLMTIVAAHISGGSVQIFQNETEPHNQQSDIADYIYHIKTMGGNGDVPVSYPVEKEKELMSLIARGDKAGSQKLLNEILGYVFFSTGGNFDLIKARILELVVVLSRAALEGGADVEQIFGLNYKYLSQIHTFKTVDELTYWLSDIMTRFTDCVFNLTEVKHFDVIYKALDYIKRNYMKKISLDEVAAHVHLSKTYFCAVFKDEMKCSFNTYINKVRIDMSKKLLLDEGMTLVEIAYCVGYEDQSYFTKVFKSQVGVSPGKYRERKGQLENVT